MVLTDATSVGRSINPAGNGWVVFSVGLNERFNGKIMTFRLTHI